MAQEDPHATGGEPTTYSRRTFIKGVIASGVAVFFRGLPFPQHPSSDRKGLESRQRRASRDAVR